MNATGEYRLFRALAMRARLLLAFVVIASVVSFGVAEVVANQETETASLALPVLDTHDHWHAEVDAFGDRVSSAFGVSEEVSTMFSSWILEAAQRQGFDPDLLAGLIATESSFRTNVRSYVGAVGPAQVRPDYWSRFCGTSDLTDPEQNVYCGAQVLAYYRERCGDITCALVAYNVGLYAKRPHAARRYISKVDGYRTALSGAAAL